MRVLVADDHPLYREGLVLALSTLPGVEVVAEVGDGAQAVDRALELAPDVVVMDLSMPGTDGIEATRRLVAQRPGVAVLVLTMLENDESVFAAMRAGARGYLLKGAGRPEIARALEQVARGELVFSPQIAARVLTFFAGGAGSPEPFPELTSREREVLDLVARGLTNAEIGRRLFLSDKTVRNHVSNVFGKLHVSDRAAAVARARDAGLGRPAGPPGSGAPGRSGGPTG